MYIPPALLSRSNVEANATGGGGGLETNTVVFIVVGVVCLLGILTGFYLVSRRRGRPNATPSVNSSLPQKSPTIEPKSEPRLERWKIWKTWRHSKSAEPPTIPDSPVSQVSPASATISSPAHLSPVRHGSHTRLPSPVRPSHTRHLTSLSVTTSFSHSHITDEALNDFRLSAYDLDGDLEEEMLHSASAREDVWPCHPLAVEDCREVVGGEEAEQMQGGVVGYSAEGYVLSNFRDELVGGGDYESAGARFEGVVADGKCVEGSMIRIEIEEVSIRRQVLET